WRAVFQLHAAQEHVLVRETSFTLAEPRMPRRIFYPDYRRHVVLDRCDERIPSRLELEPVLVLELVRDERAAPLLPVHEALVLQELDGLAHGHARDFEFLLELLQGRDL